MFVVTNLCVGYRKAGGVPMSSMKMELKAISQHDVDLTFSGSEGGSEADEDEVHEQGKLAAGVDGNESDRSSLDFDEEEMDRAFAKGGALGPYDEDEEEDNEDKAPSKKKTNKSQETSGEYAGVTGGSDEDSSSDDDEAAEAAAKADAKRGRGRGKAAAAAPNSRTSKKPSGAAEDDEAVAAPSGGHKSKRTRTK